MTNNDFNWEVLSVDETNKSFLVRYTKIDGTNDITLNLPSPSSTIIDLKGYIEQYAPLNTWYPPVSILILDSTHIGLKGTTTDIPSLDTVKKTKIIELGAKRVQLEQGGITYAEHVIPTTKLSRLLISTIYSSLLLDPTKIIDFKITDGVFIQLNLTELTTIVQLIFNLVQSSFTREKEAIDKVNASTTIEEISIIAL